MSTTAFLSRPRLDYEATTLPDWQRQLVFAHGSCPLDANKNMHKRHELSPERQDKADLQRARQAIEWRWQQSQPAVVRFQKMCRKSALGNRLPGDFGSARVHLNPLRAWCRLRTSAYLIDNVPPPATILLFAVGEVFATRVFDLEGQTLINELEDYQPCTLDQWSSLSALANRDQLVALCRELSDSGLICCS